ncbi:MAG: glycosyltransferase family 39 protein [bacterium]|nr:glycosyltransferase family 39 protein [bacterium]
MKEKLKKTLGNELFILGVILLLALILRLINLGAEPYWGDESLSLDIVKHYSGDLSGMINYLKEIEIHPPLYYILLKYWSLWFGYAEAAIRSLSLIFGLGTVWLVYYAGKKFYPAAKFGLIAAFITAILPLQIEFSQEARPYIFVCFFGLLNILGLWQFLETKNKKYLALFIASAVTGIYLHYSFAFILAATLSWWLLNLIREKKGREIIYWLSSIFIIFLGFYYWLTAFLYKIVLSQVELSGLARTVTNLRSFEFFEAKFYNLLWLTKEKLISPLEIFTVGLFKIIFAGLLFVWLYRNKDNLKAWLAEEGKKIFYFLWLIFIPLGLFLFSPQSYAYSTIMERHIITASLALIFIISALVINLKPKEKLLILTLFCLSAANFDVRVIGDDSVWDPFHRGKIVADYINKNYRTGDLVAVYGSSGRTDFNHFLRPEISAVGVYPIFPLAWQDDYLSSRETLGFLENESQLRANTPTEQEFNLRIDYLLKKYKPSRIWLYGDGKLLNEWLLADNWRHAIVSSGRLFPVNLYVKK